MPRPRKPSKKAVRKPKATPRAKKTLTEQPAETPGRHIIEYCRDGDCWKQWKSYATSGEMTKALEQLRGMPAHQDKQFRVQQKENQ